MKNYCNLLKIKKYILNIFAKINKIHNKLKNSKLIHLVVLRIVLKLVSH
jgi:hypothetical protein